MHKASNLGDNEQLEALWARCEPEPNSGCLLWLGSRDALGYGLVRFEGYVIRVHRLVFWLLSGAAPEGMQVCHRCDFPPCCRPEHLFLGTNRENCADKMAKGRHPRLKIKGGAKLSASDIPGIRRRLAAGERHTAIARDVGISRASITAIKNGWCWSDVPGGEAPPPASHDA